MATVRIEQELSEFLRVAQYLNLLPESAPEELLLLRKLYLEKLNRMVERELYSRYKTAPTEEQREEARQDYLNRRGVPESFRWRPNQEWK